MSDNPNLEPCPSEAIHARVLRCCRAIAGGRTTAAKGADFLCAMFDATPSSAPVAEGVTERARELLAEAIAAAPCPKPSASGWIGEAAIRAIEAALQSQSLMLERAMEEVVAWLREQSDKGADSGIAAEKGSTKRAAFGGGSLALWRAADAIERGEHKALRDGCLSGCREGDDGEK
jgi:hypothetical protein